MQLFNLFLNEIKIIEDKFLKELKILEKETKTIKKV